ncbi:MAG: hypothetical protein KF764_26815 [Labilithrix sp.]|nr:hypothetical protein [Labilithrix sp.]
MPPLSASAELEKNRASAAWGGAPGEHGAGARRRAIVAGRLLVLCLALAAFLIAPHRLTVPATAAGPTTSITPVPDDDPPMVLEEDGELVRVPVTRPSRPLPRTNAMAATLALAPSTSVGVSAERASFRLEARRAPAAGDAPVRTHADLMVFLL